MILFTEGKDDRKFLSAPDKVVTDVYPVSDWPAKIWVLAEDENVPDLLSMDSVAGHACEEAMLRAVNENAPHTFLRPNAALQMRLPLASFLQCAAPVALSLSAMGFADTQIHDGWDLRSVALALQHLQSHSVWLDSSLTLSLERPSQPFSLTAIPSKAVDGAQGRIVNILHQERVADLHQLATPVERARLLSCAGAGNGLFLWEPSPSGAPLLTQQEFLFLCA